MTELPSGGEVTRRREATARPETVLCGWCGTTVEVPSRGRVPLWCGTSCRHRAWEQNRAAASGLAAREVVERVVERTVTFTVRVPGPPPPEPARGSPPKAPTRPDDWARVLGELTRQIDTGRIYSRDLHTITAALNSAQQASNRRQNHRR